MNGTTGGLNRRAFLGLAAGVAGGAAGAMALAGTMGQSAPAAPGVAPGRTRRDRALALRLAHLTDLHIQPERRAGEGVAACLTHVMARRDKVDLVVTGGDLVMDSFGATHDRTKVQWDLFTRTMKDHCGVTVEHCLGNHDIFGWDKKKSKTTGEEREWGKRWALDALGLERAYRAVTRAGWKIIILDSVSPEGDGYVGRLDEAQKDWLARELAASGTTPTCVVSHIPIISACAMLGDSDTKDRAWTTPFASLHEDGAELHRMFVEAGNVKLCLSGHIHLLDRVEVGVPGGGVDSPRVTYLCDGAVCGSWWQGRKKQCDEGYGVVELFDDGSFEHRYDTFGWKAQG